MRFPVFGAVTALALLSPLPADAATLGTGAGFSASDPIPILGQDADPGLTVSVEWLGSHLEDPELVLLHVGAEAEYQEGHIPGARLIQLSGISLPVEQGSDALRLEMPSPEVLREALEGFGVRDDSRIVVYFGSDWVTPATRVVFTLDYLGLGARTSLLNGGMPAWSGAGFALTTEVPQADSGHLTPGPARSRLIVDAEFVEGVGARTGFVLVDARDAVFYDGTRPTNEREGHVPGAVNIPFSGIVNEELFLEGDRVAEAFSRAGIQPGDTIVAYCHIGQQATTVLFGARLLGHPVRLYDGSFQDWAMRDLPVEKGTGR